jgi:hypothetical protein
MLGHRTRVPVVNRPKVEQVTDHLPTSPAGHQDRAPNDRHQFRKLKAFAGGCRRLSQVTLLGGPRFHTFAVLFHRLNDFRNAVRSESNRTRAFSPLPAVGGSPFVH